MPRFLPPNHSGVHRLACLSLYHALLSQTCRSWVGKQRSRDLQNLITTRFRRDKDLVSTSKISGSLHAGYEALDLLQSCSQGNETSIDRIDELLAKTKALQESVALQRQHAGATSTTPLKPQRKRAAGTTERSVEKSQLDTAGRQQHSILSRPRPHVSGIRRVPAFVNARGVPFLRIKKPQPAALSRTLNGKLEHMWERILRRKRLEEELTMAAAEDEWDSRTGHFENPSWASCVKTSLSDVIRKIEQKNEENELLSKKMFDVVLQERKLAEKERKEKEQLRRVLDPQEERTDSEDVSSTS